MKVFRYTIRPTSPWASSLHSDTLHGLLACQIREWEGEEKCKLFLKSFKTDTPDITCSSAFPAGHLPMPCLPALSRRDIKNNKNCSDKTDFLHLLKKYQKFKKQKFIPYEWIQQQETVSNVDFFDKFCAEQEKKEKLNFLEEKKRCLAIEPHNSINRLTNSMAENGLFFHTVDYGEKELDLYVRANDSNLQIFDKYLDLLGKVGFGADSNLGKGRFEVVSKTDVGNDFSKQGNAFLTLSVLSAEKLDSIEGYYRIFGKKGKTWSYMSGRSPFKKPFLALEEGALLKADSLPKNCYLTNIHENSDIIQMTHTLTLACTYTFERKQQP